VLCVETNSSGALALVNPQPADVSSCVAVVVSPGELSVPWAISREDGGGLSAAIIAVWVVGWSIRMLVRTLNVDSESEGSS
jgi:hypothetical protein